jgi:DNA-binding HxlR family transcriptional regulator
MSRTIARKSRSGCPIATTLDVVGDRWSLVIVRDLLNGKSRFGEFIRSPEKITTSILAERLERLANAGVIEASAYQENPLRFEYRLTEMGEAMLPMLQEICRWANRYMPDTWRAPEAFMKRTVPARSSRRRSDAGKN